LITPKRIEFAGGGTAGHLFPALALAEEFRRNFPFCEILFWGTKHGVEYRLKEKLGYPLRTIQIHGFRRRFAITNFLIPLEFCWSECRLLFHFLWHRPDLVVGTGGYVSGPVVSLATILRINTIIQEQNSFPGMTTRLLSRWVKRVYLTYESSRTFFSKQKKLRVVGNPVRRQPERLDPEPARKLFALRSDCQTLLIFGGSQGGLGLNKLMLEVAPKLLADSTIQIIWATGPAHFERIRGELHGFADLHLFPFIDAMYAAYSVSDLVICRSGATTIAELTYLGKPAVLIPFPFATAGHQEFNARELAKAGAALCFIEDKTSGEQLFTAIKDLLANKNKLMQMQEQMKNLARPNAAYDIVSDVRDTFFIDPRA